MNPQAASVFYMKSGLKAKRRRKKSRKSREKKLQIFFCLGASTYRDEMPIIKVAYFILNFLNLKSFPSYLFFVVASSLSTLCKGKERYKVSLFFLSNLFLESRAEILKQISLAFWSKRWHQKVLLKLTDLSLVHTIHYFFRSKVGNSRIRDVCS